MRANTVFGSKLKLERFVMLLWNFTERGKSYQQISNAANLPPQAHYVEDKLSPNSIANFIIILLSHFHFCHIKICFRYRNSNVSSKSPGDGGRGLGRHELNCFADNSFVNQNVNKFSVFFVNQMVYYIFALNLMGRGVLVIIQKYKTHSLTPSSNVELGHHCHTDTVSFPLTLCHSQSTA